MKKRQIILYIVIMLLLLCTSVYATVTGSLSLTSSASTTAVSQGDSFNVVLSITDIDENYGITGIDGYFQIDPDVYETLELSDITSLIDGLYVCDASDVDAEYEDEVIAINFDYASSGIYYVAIDSATGITSTSDILQINLTVKDSVEDGTYYNTVQSVNFTVASGGNVGDEIDVADQSLIVLIGNTSSSGGDNTNNNVSNNNVTNNESNNNTDNNNSNNNSSNNNANTNNNASNNANVNASSTNNVVDNTVASGSLPNTGYKLVLIPIFVLVIVGFVFYKKYTTYNNIK